MKNGFSFHFICKFTYVSIKNEKFYVNTMRA